MRISVSEAKSQLTDLVLCAEAGEEVVLMRHGQAVVRLVPVIMVLKRRSRQALLERVRNSAVATVITGSSAARNQDFLYHSDGLPR